MEDRRKVALLDADSILYIAGWDKDNKCYSEDFELTCKQADSFITHILLSVKATHYIGFLSPSQSFRKLQFTSYKANRDKLIRPPLIHEMKVYLMTRWLFRRLDNLEADDGVNICKKLISDSVICSPDKDVLNLPGTHYNYKKDEWVTTSEESAIRYFWEDMIIGQSGDGISGLKGKGKAYVKEVFKEFLPDYRKIVFDEYIKAYGEYKGIEEFYKNYKLLKILDTDNEFEQTYKDLIENPLEVKLSLLV